MRMLFRTKDIRVFSQVKVFGRLTLGSKYLHRPPSNNSIEELLNGPNIFALCPKHFQAT